MIINFLSPIWEKIISLVFDRLYPLVTDKYKIMSRKKKILMIVIGIILIIVGVVCAFSYYDTKSVSITDIAFYNTREQLTQVDITVKNTDENTDILIKKICIRIKECYELLPVVLNREDVILLTDLPDPDVPLGYLDSSYTYDFILDEDNKILEEQTLTSSQVIPSKGYDKFSVMILEENIKPRIVRLEFELILDNGEHVKSEECILSLGYVLPDEQMEMYSDTPYDIDLENAVENYNELKKFEEYGCKYVSDYFRRLIDSYKEMINNL